MSTLSAGIARVQDKLLHPSYPDASRIADALIETVDEKVTLANQSRVPWYLVKAQLAINANQVTYNLDGVAPDFDKIRYAYGVAANPATQNPPRYPFDIVPYESLTEWYQLGSITEVTPSTSPLAYQADRACAIYYDATLGETMMEITPVPSSSYTLILIYETNIQRPQAMGEALFRFPQFDGYVTDCGALRVLTQCKWSDCPTEADCQARQQNLAGNLQQGYGLVADVARGDSIYFKWRHSGKNPSGIRAIGFGRARW